MADLPLQMSHVIWSPNIGNFTLGALSIEAKPHRVIALVGPNGAGKSSIIRLVAGIQQPDSGKLDVFGKTPSRWSSRERGRILAYLSQEPERPFGFSVWDYVSFGRFPHRGPFRNHRAEDRIIIEQEIEAWGLSELTYRPVNTLSGGEFQRARFARALTQNPGLLLLDEPGNHLDITSRVNIFKRLKKEATNGRCILAVIHDVNDALLYADEVWLIFDGRIIETGEPKNVLTSDKLESVYGVRLTPFRNPTGLTMLGVP